MSAESVYLNTIYKWLHREGLDNSLAIALDGQRGRELPDFSVFACLYPDPPVYRIVREPAHPQPELTNAFIRQRLLSFAIPPKELQAQKARLFVDIPQEDFMIAELEARIKNRPIAMVAFGQTLALLCTYRHAPADYVLQRLKVACS